MLKFIDLFAGIGGIRIGMERAGFHCVFSNDFDRNAKITYDFNFYSLADHELLLKDIRNVQNDDLPHFDILCGGFPCQPFSVAGYRHGFNDSQGRGEIFFEIVRILRGKLPKVILLENVKNLQTHDKGHTYQTICSELTELGYHIHAKVMNSMDYGNIPQNRERIYIIGFLDKQAFTKFRFPEVCLRTTQIKDCLETNVDDKYYYNDKPLYQELKNEVIQKNTIYQWRRKYVRQNKNQVCPTLTANMGMGGHNVPIILDDIGVRKLTPRECANFQGFPRDYKLPQIADSHLYKQFGNSVTVSVIERIANNIRLALET